MLTCASADSTSSRRCLRVRSLRKTSGSSTFSNVVMSLMRLKAWKMNPMSRLRTRACSVGCSPVTSAPLRKYFPSDAELSRPMTESSVDLPQPEGPLIETYSPS